MQEKLFAEILVPKSRADGSHSRSEAATGYLVGPCCVLTASHVLHPEGRDEDAPIEVRFPEIDPKQRIRCRIAWDGADADLDAAVLHLESPGEQKAPLDRVWLGFSPLAGSRTWEARGYAEVGESTAKDGAATCKLEPFSGHAYAWAPGARECTLDVDVSPAHAPDWGGMSGAPVFCEDRLIAVVCSYPKRFGGRRLRAVPIAALRAEPGFRDALGLAEKDSFVPAREALLRDLDAIWDAARRSFRDALEDVGLAEIEVTPKAVAEALVHGLTVSQVLDVLDRVHGELFGKDLSAAVRIEQALWSLLPFLYGTSADQPAVLRSESAASIVSVPIASPTLAEVISADLDGSPVCFERPMRLADPPGGTFLVAGSPELSVAAGPKEMVDEIRKQLELELLQRRDRRRNEAAMLKVLNNKIRFQATRADRRRRYYLAIERSLCDGWLEPLTAELRRVLPELRVLVLDGSDETWVEESELAQVLTQILLRTRKSQ